MRPPSPRAVTPRLDPQRPVVLQHAGIAVFIDQGARTGRRTDRPSQTGEAQQREEESAGNDASSMRPSTRDMVCANSANRYISLLTGGIVLLTTLRAFREVVPALAGLAHGARFRTAGVSVHPRARGLATGHAAAFVTHLDLPRSLPGHFLGSGADALKAAPHVNSAPHSHLFPEPARLQRNTVTRSPQNGHSTVPRDRPISDTSRLTSHGRISSGSWPLTWLIIVIILPHDAPI